MRTAVAARLSSSPHEERAGIEERGEVLVPPPLPALSSIRWRRGSDSVVSSSGDTPGLNCCLTYDLTYSPSRLSIFVVLNRLAVGE